MSSFQWWIGLSHPGLWAHLVPLSFLINERILFVFYFLQWLYIVIGFVIFTFVNNAAGAAGGGGGGQ